MRNEKCTLDQSPRCALEIGLAQVTTHCSTRKNYCINNFPSSTYTDIYLDHCPRSPRAIFCQTTVLEESNTTPTARAWLLNWLPFDARLVQSLNVKHTSIKMANTFPNRSLFYSYHHPALRTLLLRTASHCCGRWVRASKQAIQLKAWVWPEAGWNQYTVPPLHFGRQNRAITGQ